MEFKHFDQIASRFATTRNRRGALGLMAGLLGMSELTALSQDAQARRKKKKKKKKNKNNNDGGGGANKSLRQMCTPGQDTCSAGLQCATPTTRHSCSSTVQGVSAWCCVPPGGACTECDCCGDFYCEFDDNNNPTCQPNPEG